MHMMKHFRFFMREIHLLMKSRLFLFLTFVGNGMIGLAGLLFYFLERGSNSKVTTYMDAIWWSFSTATTTGFGDIIPVTTAGRILSILLMLMGLAIFAMFTALFAETILSSKKVIQEIKELNNE